MSSCAQLVQSPTTVKVIAKGICDELVPVDVANILEIADREKARENTKAVESLKAVERNAAKIKACRAGLGGRP